MTQTIGGTPDVKLARSDFNLHLQKKVHLCIYMFIYFYSSSVDISVQLELEENCSLRSRPAAARSQLYGNSSTLILRYSGITVRVVFAKPIVYSLTVIETESLDHSRHESYSQIHVHESTQESIRFPYTETTVVSPEVRGLGTRDVTTLAMIRGIYLF
jgi:hypothetical protein